MRQTAFLKGDYSPFFIVSPSKIVDARPIRPQCLLATKGFDTLKQRRRTFLPLIAPRIGPKKLPAFTPSSAAFSRNAPWIASAVKGLVSSNREAPACNISMLWAASILRPINNLGSEYESSSEFKYAQSSHSAASSSRLMRSWITGIRMSNLRSDVSTASERPSCRLRYGSSAA